MKQPVEFHCTVEKDSDQNWRVCMIIPYENISTSTVFSGKLAEYRAYEYANWMLRKKDWF